MKNFFTKQKYPQLLSFFVVAVFSFAAASSVHAAGLVTCGTGATSDAAINCGFNDFISLVQRIINFLLFVLAVPLAAIAFTYAGWLYLSSAGGNEGNVNKAHEVFKNVVIGLCIALAAWLIVHAVISGLGVSTTYNFLGS